VIEEMENKFNVHKDCYGACRQDKLNEWLYNYINASDWAKETIYNMCKSTSNFDCVEGVNFL
jgi:hypothetical protein